MKIHVWNYFLNMSLQKEEEEASILFGKLAGGEALVLK